MGGLINSQTVKGDLWMIEAGGTMACYPLATTAEGPGPRVGHSSLLVGNAFIVFGGDTKIDESDLLDETLYLLNTCMHFCFRPFFQSSSSSATDVSHSHQTVVQSSPGRAPAGRPLRALTKHTGLQDLHIWWPGRGLFYE